MASLKSLPTWSQMRSTTSLLAVPMNTDLSEDGVRMASSLRSVMDESHFVSTHGVELAVHSTLLRAAKTCAVLFDKIGIPIMEHESIYEKDISENFGLINMNLRINLFKEWLINRPESCIAVVGHSAFFRDMLNTELKLKNCEVRSCILNSDGTFEGEAVTIITGGQDLLIQDEDISIKQEQT